MPDSPEPAQSKRANAIRRGKMDGSNIDWPSGSYEEACGSYTYRISELVFGSLLASYILGFVGIGLTLAVGASDFKSATELIYSNKLAQLIQYGLISMSFAYLTAGYYVIYHSSILTMPHLPTYRLKTDFGIALLQAVLFGLSMIRPDGFLLFVGISWLRIFARQRAVFLDLVSKFTEEIKSDDTSGKSNHMLAKELINKKKVLFLETVNKINREKKYQDCLESWLPVRRGMWVAGFAAVIIGGILEARHFVPPLSDWSVKNHLWITWGQIVLYLGVTIFIGFATNKVLQTRADHVLIKPEEKAYAIDVAAQELVKSLELPKDSKSA